MGAKEVVLFILCLLFVASLFSAMYYKVSRDRAITEGAKNTVTALEMVVACQNLSGVSLDQIKERYIEMFILNKTRGNLNAAE